jgi:SEC-C motif/Nuclease-related domain
MGALNDAIENGHGADFNPFANGEAMREPIFYSGESAYISQYLDLAKVRYKNDNAWLRSNLSFTIDEAYAVIKVIETLHNQIAFEEFFKLKAVHPTNWTLLPCFKVHPSQISTVTGLEEGLVECVLDKFTLSVGDLNAQFSAVQDFNSINATPLIKSLDGQYVNFQLYALAESLYESPYYWMLQDKHYRGLASKNRGDFTEQFVGERLSLVFGKENIYSNINITKSKETVGEMDVLVAWGNRAIIVQAKSKKLTLEARKGNDLQIKDDFEKSVQDAYDQAYLCAELLTDEQYALELPDKQLLKIPRKFSEIYLFCVVSDNYPALFFQAKQFLQTKQSPIIKQPFVMDIFNLDAMTEMLQSPLYFLSYVNKRVGYSEELLASQELTILGYHLKHNLWIESGIHMMQMHDEFSTGLDLAMAVRRAGLEGEVTPQGILTKFKGKFFGNLIGSIEQTKSPAAIDLGFFLLSISEEAVNDITKAVKQLTARWRTDHKPHDLTLGFTEANAGLTIHISDMSETKAMDSLASHCKKRKYTEKAKEWFGMCLDPKTMELRFALSMNFEWKFDGDLNALMQTAMKPLGPNLTLASIPARGGKIGRNDPCPCNSGKKYKKCCTN